MNHLVPQFIRQVLVSSGGSSSSTRSLTAVAALAWKCGCATTSARVLSVVGANADCTHCCRRALRTVTTTTTTNTMTMSQILHQYNQENEFDYGIANPVHLEPLHFLTENGKTTTASTTTLPQQQQRGSVPQEQQEQSYLDHAKYVLDHFNEDDKFELHGYLDAHTLLHPHLPKNDT